MLMKASILQWFKEHDRAILVTAIAVSKAGLLGKVGQSIVSAIAIMCGVQ